LLIAPGQGGKGIFTIMTNDCAAVFKAVAPILERMSNILQRDCGMIPRIADKIIGCLFEGGACLSGEQQELPGVGQYAQRDD